MIQLALLMMLLTANTGAAQDLTPRAYFPTPVSSNAVIVTYAVSAGDVVFDPTLPVADSTGTIHGVAGSYYYAFNFFGRSANLAATLPFAAGSVRGDVSGAETDVYRAGLGDTVARLAVNLRGGPARSPLEFARAGPTRSVLGASLKVVMPTGQYDHARLINLGTHRWAFKPELGYARRVTRSCDIVKTSMSGISTSMPLARARARNRLHLNTRGGAAKYSGSGTWISQVSPIDFISAAMPSAPRYVPP